MPLSPSFAGRENPADMDKGMIGFLPTSTFNLLGLVFMLTLALIPNELLWVITFGKVPKANTWGVFGLRMIGGVCAFAFLFDIIREMRAT